MPSPYGIPRVWMAHRHARVVEHILDMLDDGMLLASEADVDFLAEVARRSHQFETRSALRLIGAMGEDCAGLDVGPSPNHVPVDAARVALESFLTDMRPGIRYTAVEGLWQIRDTAALPALEAALVRETELEVVGNFIRRTIQVLRGHAARRNP